VGRVRPPKRSRTALATRAGHSFGRVPGNCFHSRRRPRNGRIRSRWHRCKTVRSLASRRFQLLRRPAGWWRCTRGQTHSHGHLHRSRCTRPPRKGRASNRATGRAGKPPCHRTRQRHGGAMSRRRRLVRTGCFQDRGRRHRLRRKGRLCRRSMDPGHRMLEPAIRPR
jgi:hypothetical protein